MALDRETARAALGHLLADANRRTVYKGKVVYLEQEDWRGKVNIRFRDLPPAERESIILPERIMQVLERNVAGLFGHRETLRKAGWSTRHGVLLHGPPGTGKTLVLRYLVKCCPEHTVLLLTGRQAALIRESCQIARLLAPSLVILEDADLVAENRLAGQGRMLLHDLLDEMDGLGPKAEVIFLLTTNRPETLEPALAARPGRIDQAIEFPLPDAECRGRLFALYGWALDLAAVDMDRWVARTEQTSPAFIEELLRKASLMAAERGSAEPVLRLQDADLERAVEELVVFGGEVTQHLLGYKPFGFRTPALR
jgi:ATP-dependent 26S proteasome regulatory subunit